MNLFPERKSTALYISMGDIDELMSRGSPHSFSLEGYEWDTVEHYYQAMKFVNTNYQVKIRNAVSHELARKLGRTWLKKKRADFKEVRTTLMTRAIYIQAKTHANVSERIINTGDVEIVENSQFDYFWGCGRDQRGDNHYGKVLMNVRNKLLEESA